MSVTTMRIDDRLIHGQIVTRWIADAQADTILIADDMAAGDATQQMLLKLVAPANINLLIKTINEAAQLLSLIHISIRIQVPAFKVLIFMVLIQR